MNNDTITNKGERLSFLQLFIEKKWKIEIPIIQRDYAQGRKSSKEIRETFLNTFYEHLDSGKNIDLDFVYGNLSESDDRLFIPLDGQQRLTTLFLLHWYLAAKDGSIDIFNQNLIENNKSKFSYETRTSSSEFCDALVNSNIDINNLLLSDNNATNLSKTIKDSFWYFSSWDNDPTIQSMLNMLDAIHIKFYETVGHFEKLINNHQIITFQFLNLKEFKLTDDLYIKMNARGKQLTSFENFKAKFEQFIKELELNNEVKYKLFPNGAELKVHEYFSHKIDTDWANLFWNYKDEKTNVFDNQLMNFIRVIATNSYALKENSNDKSGYLNLLVGKDDNSKKDLEQTPISFLQYKEIGCLDEKFIIDLISIFDLLVNGDEKIKIYSTDQFYYDELKLFDQVIANNLNFNERIRFYALYYYLIHNKSSDALDSLTDWMRVIYNLTENTRSEVTEYLKALKSVELLLQRSSDILGYLSNPENSIAGFPDIQIKEERIKALLILRSEDWEIEILNIEKHGYFKGQIGFILNFSGIEEYYNLNKNLDFTNEENENFFLSFKDYSEKASSVFNSEGLNKYDNFIWERALLSKGEYLLKHNSNLSLLIDNERDIGWKRLLRDENSGKREFVKDLFDDELFNKDNVEESLNSIIENSDINDWRKNFVELPEMISYLGSKKYIRLDPEGYIYLLTKERMSSIHCEYYSYGFYIRYLKEKPLIPFKNNNYIPLSGDEYIPYVVIEGWRHKELDCKIYINYISQDNHFLLRFFDCNQLQLDEEIISIMEDNDFELLEEHFSLRIPEDEVMPRLELLCESFQGMSNE